MNGLTVGQIAREAQVDAWTVRFYEKEGLLPKAKRTFSGYRLHGPGITERIQFIKKAQHLGLKLDEIREILDLSDRGSCPCGHVRQVLKSKLAELAQKISDLNAVRSRIRTALSRSRRPGTRLTGKALCPTIMGNAKGKKAKGASK
ncbi:MAG: heavy metal-responsive transcriptional regulator [Candidatus Omnitrophica bacterium CG11_big_fil_rev_8_21_14_0_20_64_10]|nr:MAG: heavy metal-responsive transcriptional regulator [Candidatus Omnitrophica bacterium CG11_big_fil_rev_8_21_14_0_20_64_10]